MQERWTQRIQNPSPTPKNQSHKKNITLKQRLQFYIINKESECYSVVAVRVRVLTGVTNRGLDSVATVEKKLDKPWSYVTRGTSHTHNLPCSTAHFSLSSFFLSFFQISLLIAFWFWILVLDIELIGFAFYRKNIMSSSSISSELVKYSNAK